MTRLVFLDTETTGLEPDDEVWDFACIVRDPGQPDVEHQFFVAHDQWRAKKLPEPFLSDYEERMDWRTCLREPVAAARIGDLTAGAHIVGAVPNFDTERLDRMLRNFGIKPAWHYHLIDIENVAYGYLRYDRKHNLTWSPENDPPAVIAEQQRLDGVLSLPWDSDALSVEIGVVSPRQGEGRHTALGDARWVRDLWDRIHRYG